MTAALLIIYFALLGVLALLGIYRLLLTGAAFLSKKANTSGEPQAWPELLVQLPLYNESFVARRLLEAASALEYEGPLTIQVLDDSTDDTQAVVDRTAQTLRARGVSIEVVRRPDRVGYKAGALAYGLKRSSAPLVAIFDADFIPPPDFFKRTVPGLLSDPKIGLVQARWGHLNRDVSLLTKAQAVFLNGHFAIEHRARAAMGHFFNFNGTAGIWRRAAIEEAGGWSADTITEDLDLSYRAQIAGWKFRYQNEVVAPAELPESWAAFRSQQARWVRGSVETARKHLGALLFSSQLRGKLRLGVRLDAAVHLTHNFAYLLMAALACLLPLTVVARDQLGWRVPGGQLLLSVLDLSMLTAGTCAMAIFYYAALISTDGRKGWSRLGDVFFALCLGAGMSLSNAREVLRGLGSKRSEFVRTPKRGEAQAETAQVKYRSKLASSIVLLELVFAAYFAVAVIYALRYQLWGALPFLLLYLLGFSAVGLGSVMEARRRSRPKAAMDVIPARSA